MGLGVSTTKLIIHESFFGSNMGNLQGALAGFSNVLAAVCSAQTAQTMRLGKRIQKG